MQDDSLQKYLKNELSPEDRKFVNGWIKESDENGKYFNALKARYVAKSLNQSSIADSKTAYELFERKKNKRRWSHYASYAAIGLIFLSTSFFLLKDSLSYDQKDHKFLKDKLQFAESSNVNKESVVLPDGSTVVLNIDSRIEYPASFTGETRRILLYGEAIFDIVHDSLHPFIVQTEHYDVKVLGTTFNVKSYPNDTQTETTLITGKVELLRDKQNPIVLSPSEKAVFHKVENKVKVKKVISADVVAWQKGTLVFNNTPLQQVALDLERKHNKKITINSVRLLKYEYTGTLDNLTLEESLELLKISSPIDFRISENEIVLKMKE
ncbi:FecR family protein [Zobellia alginiliquefaciens]|uniref:FecR family protein n=1 Tax=Zobellia alginiliquefaciens TaxID=3032586 RepID=UPI0023E44569|nr:FecR family protein [Zobellia alginiliquefaciens]